MRQRALRHRLPAASRVLVLVPLLLLALPTVALSQTAADYTRLGNEAYNGSKYAEAVSAYIKAIQTEPRNAAKAYLNMARAYNQLEQYSHAHQYYQWYLEQVPDDQDARKVRAELRRVSHKLRGDSPAPVLSEAQRAAVAQLETSLESGPYQTEQGGGAYAFYQVLIRTNYAAPNLAAIQQRLVEGLLAESQQAAAVPEGRPAPPLDRAGWSHVRKRLELAGGFLGVEIDGAAVNNLRQLSAAWESYFKGDYSGALGVFESVVDADPTLLAAHWGRVLCLLYSPDSGDALRAALDQAERAFVDAGRGELEHHFTVLRAIALQGGGHNEVAAKLLLSLGG